ncbi:hypothetical protein ACFOLL_12660 [Falsochrobactrum ovis]|uniref:Uncharacterized protein n=1 Tax=Falsochrobactrum ovis TaxID=1293442 RepID=A0A364JST0_9HYPH|nr:hypothetical protein [Falsochrobactrum ovis]RAK26364.1 hypothetical protein C7374_11450 [Falsochrobactrum ovis]
MLGKLLRAAYDTATLPVSVAADVVTVGGVLNDRDEAYIATKLKRIGHDVAKVMDDLAS